MATRPSSPPGDGFVSTRWTLVLRAGRQSSPESARALEELCRTYWYPLYAYVRRRGSTKEDAEDLVQSFFERFLQRNYLEGLAAERGKFRAFLLASLKHFLANAWDRSQRIKRGGGQSLLSLDWDRAEEKFCLEPLDQDSPDRVFDREWATALLGRVIELLRESCVAEGRGDWFEQAKDFLMVGVDAVPYAEAARQAGMEEAAMRVAVHRLRKRYRELLRAEIAQTLADPTQVAEEMQSLFAALSGPAAGAGGKP